MYESSHLGPAWDAYLHEHPEALFTHCRGYVAAVAATYHLPYYLLTTRAADGRLTGILPLVLFAAPEMARRLISLPYSDGAGLLADSPGAAGDLLAQALLLAERLGCQHLELRQPGSIDLQLPQLQHAGWHHRQHTFKIGLSRFLPKSACTLWAELPDKVRNQVRKAKKSGATVRIGGVDLLGDFFAVFSENMRDLGSPVHDYRLFARLVDADSQDAEVVVVYLAGKAAAAAMVFRHGQTMFNPWASSLRRLRPFCPNMLLYWTMLDLAITRGCRIFDFGRSTPDSPAHLFKKQWGAEQTSLSWYVFSRAGASWQPQLESLVDSDWMTMPLAKSRLLGPLRRRWISL